MLVILFVLLQETRAGRNFSEAIAYRIDPTPERAYEYAERHFDRAYAGNYDLARASYFYNEALRLEGEMPFVRHQLARLAFLDSNFTYALSLIDEEINLPDGPASPSSFYIKGLIEGYMELYAQSAIDFARYLESDPTNWAATNDLAWVLLKDKRPEDALIVIERVLPLWPENPWLLNSKATALYEMGQLEEALRAAEKASHAISSLTENEWLLAYPGNDPLIAPAGLSAFQEATEANLERISAQLAKERASQ